MMPENESAISTGYQIQVVWCSVDSSTGESRLEAYPKKKDASVRFLLTNEPSVLIPFYSGTDLTDWHIVDIAELFRILFPESSANSIDEMLPPGPQRSPGSATLPPQDIAKHGGKGLAPSGAENAEAPAARQSVSNLSPSSDVMRLWNLWQRCNSKIDALPAWILDTVGIACREGDEDGLAALFFRLASLRDGENRQWHKYFPRTVTKVERPQLPQLADCSALDPDEVASFLDEGGVMSTLVPDYEPRPGQIKMLKAVVEAFNNGKHLIAEAGTGVGKSLAYLLPAAMWAKLNDVPVVISTNTKNLQTQLVEKDLPAVLKMLATLPSDRFVSDKPLAAAVIKGRSNYICLKRLGQLVENGLFDLSRSDLRCFAQTLCWVANTFDGDLDSLTGGASIDPSFLQLLTCSSEECGGRACRHYAQCFIQKARERSLRANLIIANHSLVFTELDAEQPIAIPDHAQIIFDEAHNLEEAATKFFTHELSPGVVSKVLKRFNAKRGKTLTGVLNQLRKRYDKGVVCPTEPNHTLMGTALDSAFEAVDLLKVKSDELFESLYPLLGKNDDSHRFAFELPEDAPPEAMPEPADANWRLIRERHLNFNDAIARLKRASESVSAIIERDTRDQLNLVSNESGDLTSALSLLDALEKTANIVLSGCDKDYVFWVQNSFSNKKNKFGEACAAPLNVSQFLSEYIYKKKSSVILSSATLSVGGRFNFIASRLGLDLIEKDRIQVCIAPSPFDYVRQSALLIPQFLPEPGATDRSYTDELSELICELAVKYGGRTICLFTSYDMLKRCARNIEAKLEKQNIHLLIHGESGSRNMITREFRKDGRTVLLGTQSFWEGVDVVGEALSCVVVARLPFASPGDPIVSARCEQIEQSGKSSFGELSLPSAVLRLRQGFGRLIRHRNDRGCVVIADTRIVTKSYGAVFRNSLPCPAKKCSDLETLLSSLII